MNTRYYLTTKRILDENSNRFSRSYWLPADNRHPDNVVGPDDLVVVALDHPDPGSLNKWQNTLGVEALPDPLRRLPIKPLHQEALKKYHDNPQDMFDLIDAFCKREPNFEFRIK